MRLTWRGYAARYYAYLDCGEGLCGRVYKLLVAGAALKILFPSIPLWVMFACSPVVIVAYVGIGRLWLTAGWYREQMEVGVVNALDPVHMFQTHALSRLLDHAQLPQNGYDPTKVPEGLAPYLRSAKQ